MKQLNRTEQDIRMDALMIEIKLSINHHLYQKGYITEELYKKVKEAIIKS